jgi:phage terminase small subunit
MRRGSYQVSDVVPYGADSARLNPPASLGDAEKRAFADLILSCPRAQFVPSDVPLLARWAELTVMAETAAAELRTHGLVTGKGAVSPWFVIHRDATKELRSLAMRLRLGPQSRAFKAPKKRPATVSYYERMDLEGEPDEPH